MVITLCSLPVNILFIIIFIIGVLNRELHVVHTLIFEESDPLSRSQVLNETSMSSESHFVVVSYPFSDTGDRSLHSHVVELNCDFGTICFALNVD